jgi:tetratricopeptide (TPR) repeat protein
LELNPDHEKARIAINNVVKNTFNDGNNAYRRGNLEGAMDLYHKVLTFDSTFTRAHYQIGVIETKRGNLSIAIDAYSQAIKIDSTFYQGWFALGLAQNKYGNSSDALKSFQKAVEIDSTYAKAYSSMGDIYIKGRNYEMAIEVLNTAIAVQPNYPKPFISLGMVYMELVSMPDIQRKIFKNENIEDFSQLQTFAEAYLENLANQDFDPASAALRKDLSNIVDQKSLLEMAKIHLEKGTSLDPKNGGAWVRLASVHNQLKDCESAKIAAREATDRKKRFGAGWYELGIAEWCNGKGNKTAALNALEKAREDRSWRQMAEYEIDKIKNPAKYEE